MPVCYGKEDSLLTCHGHGRTLAENDHVQISHRQTSLVTRIARYVGVLENAHVTYLPATDEYRTFIGLDHFVHAHMMREGPVYIGHMMREGPVYIGHMMQTV